MLKIHLTATETVINFQSGFGCYGVSLALKIWLRRFDGVKRTVLDSKPARLT